MSTSDEAQAQVLTSDECTILEGIGARIQDAMWPERYVYRTKAGVSIKFTLKEEQ